MPLIDISKPGLFNQPEHMDDYRNLPSNCVNDHGGVHTNGGIHNKAAYNLIISKNGEGENLFDTNEVALLFYLSLI